MSSLKQIHFLFLLPLLVFSAHKYYLSLTEIEYNKDQKSLEVIINVFMDDIETALNNDYAIDLRLTSKNELKNADVYFKKYLRKKLNFTIDHKAFEFEYIGKEYQGDLVYFYLEIDSIDDPYPLEVTNKILLDEFRSQQNIIKFKDGKNKKSMILSNKINKALLNF